MKLFNRRTMIKHMGAMGALTVFGSSIGNCESKTSPFPIGACDWSIGKAGDPAAFEVAKAIGLDGIQVSLGNAQNDMHLRQEKMQQIYLEASKKHKVKIASLAIGELNNVPYKSAPETEAWVADAIDVAGELNCQVILLAFFGKGDLRGDEKGKAEVIRRLKKVAPKAEKQDIYLAIESWLSAEEHLEIIEAIGSSHIKVYYDVANATKMGYDIFREMKLLGTEYLCEIHFKENGHLLGQGLVDFQQVKATLLTIGYQKWVVMEGAIPEGAAMLPSYQQNLKFVRNLLQT